MSDEKVIQFPKDDKKIDADKAEVENLVQAWVDDIAIMMLQRCSDMGCNIEREAFVRDFSLTVDMLRATIKRDVGLNHVLQKISNKIVTLEESKDGLQLSRIEYGHIYNPKTKQVQVIEDEENDTWIQFIPDWETEGDQ